MESIFQGASSFNQDIGYWNISSMNNQNGVNNMFANSGLTADLSYWCFPTSSTYGNRFNIYGNSSISGIPRWNHRGNCRTPKVAPPPSGSNSPATLTITSNDSDNVINEVMDIVDELKELKILTAAQHKKFLKKYINI